jgi:hypothetical protein
VGRQLAGSLGVPFVELDAIFHLPGWGELPRDDFRQRVSEALTADRWVVDGNYSAVQDLVWQRADTVVWLDPPRPLGPREERDPLGVGQVPGVRRALRRRHARRRLRPRVATARSAQRSAIPREPRSTWPTKPPVSSRRVLGAHASP